MNTFKDIRKIVENMDSAEAHYCLGYIRGFHGIKDKKEDCIKQYLKQKGKVVLKNV